MKYLPILILILTIGTACNDDSSSVPYPAKYVYSNAEYPTEYTFFTADSDTMVGVFNPIGSSVEDGYNFLLNSDLDTFFEGIDDDMSQLFEIELISPTVLIFTGWDDGIPVDTTLGYIISNGELIIDGIQFTSDDFKINYNEAADRLELVFSVELFSNYSPTTGRSITNIRLIHFGDIEFGDTDEVLSRYPLGPQDTIGTGFGHFVWEKI